MDKEIIESELSSLSEAEERDHAVCLALKQYRKAEINDSEKLRRRLYEYLIRRGFDSSLAKQALKQVVSSEERK